MTWKETLRQGNALIRGRALALPQKSHIVTLPTGIFVDDNVHLYHSQSPQLADWIAGFFADDKTGPVYDFGCGTGFYLEHLRKRGFSSLRGFEGDPPKVAHFAGIEKADLTEPMPTLPPGNCICLEVAEHIPAQFEGALLSKIADACSGKLVMSWAVRGQPGDGHINCLDNDEAVARLTSAGFTTLPEATASARATIRTECSYFKNTLLVFEKSTEARSVQP